MIRSRSNRGFTLIEIMVGLVIGLIATVIIFQVFEVAERQKRTTTGTSDAQGNGAIAVFMMERHMKMAGAGLNHDTFEGCTTLHTFDADLGGPIDATGGSSLFNVAAIGDGASPSGSDTITLLYYDDPSNPEFRYSDSLLSATVNNPSLDLQPLTAHNCNAGGMALMAQSGTCMLMSVTGVTPSSGTSTPATVRHDPAPAGRYNPAAGVSMSWGSYNKYSARFQCFPGLFRVTYGINTRQLEVTEPDPAVPGATRTTPVVPDILDLQAQYGIDNPALVPPIEWVDATGATWGAPSLADVRRIRAVRVAILALNSEYQKPPTDTGVCDATTDAMRAGWSSWANLNPPADLTPDFHCYRFKVFESVIPLRNILWAN
ncbi:MAG: PilW family protein [Rhodocyclales bacterium]|nr:PilW family protein [Rhodocyclales bacterium]